MYRSDFFALLRAAIKDEPYRGDIDAKAWESVFFQAQRQALSGMMWTAVKDRELPPDIVFQWVGIVESIRGLNELQNREAARLTRAFEEVGRKSVILKGQANAMLYPDKLLRQPGDIDIWVEGGRESVIALLFDLGLLNERPTMANRGKKNKATASYHHIHLPANENGIEVEVHFRPSSGNFCPWTNRRLQAWLEREVLSATKVEEGFRVPSIRFALVMQLAHIQRHFFTEGVGLRQICDYYWLLRHSTPEDRQAVQKMLGRFGLRRTTGALMWMLGELLHLDEDLMICEKDEWRGKWMLRGIMAGGNFGHYADRQQAGLWHRWIAERTRRLRLTRFDFWEVVWMEIRYWQTIVRTVPERIKRRKLSLK